MPKAGGEGPRKLQGYKALNSQHAQVKTEETVQELTAVLDRLSPIPDSELEKHSKYQLNLKCPKADVDKMSARLPI